MLLTVFLVTLFLTGWMSAGMEIQAQVELETNFEEGEKWVIERSTDMRGRLKFTRGAGLEKRVVSSRQSLTIVREFHDVKQNIPYEIRQRYKWGNVKFQKRLAASPREKEHPLTGQKISFRWNPEKKYYVLEEFSKDVPRSALKREVFLLQFFQRFLPTSPVSEDSDWSMNFTPPLSFFVDAGSKDLSVKFPVEMNPGRGRIGRLSGGQSTRKAVITFQFPLVAKRPPEKNLQLPGFQGTLKYDVKNGKPMELSMKIPRIEEVFRRNMKEDLEVSVSDFGFQFSHKYDTASNSDLDD